MVKEWVKPVAVVVLGMVIFMVLEPHIKGVLKKTGMWEEV